MWEDPARGKVHKPGNNELEEKKHETLKLQIL